MALSISTGGQFCTELGVITCLKLLFGANSIRVVGAINCLYTSSLGDFQKRIYQSEEWGKDGGSVMNVVNFHRSEVPTVLV